MIHEVLNLRFTSRKMREDPNDTTWLIDTRRISDHHWLPDQMWFDSEPSREEVENAANEWIARHPGMNSEPPPVHCLACNKVLESDHDTDYQFNNALWIAFHGGYGMFTDNCFEAIGRKLPGQPDHEAVICHECAHELCATVPWIDKLIQPLSSHAHRVDKIPTLLAEGHRGWDLERHYAEQKDTDE